MNLLVPAAGAAAILYFTGLKSQGERLAKCEVQSFKLGKLTIGLQQSTIPVTLNIFNPNNTDVPAEYFRGIIRRAGNKIADFNFDSKGKAVMLKKRETTPLTFNVNITTAGIVANIWNLFKNIGLQNVNALTFQVEGIITIGGFDIPINYTWDAKNSKLIGGGVNGIAGIGRVESQQTLDAEIENYFESTVPPGKKDRAQYAVEVQKITDYLQKLTKSFDDVKLSVAQNEIRFKYNKGNGFARIKLDPVRKEILLPKLKAILRAKSISGIGDPGNYIIRLKPLELFPLSTQLQNLTGDGYNVFDWEMEDGSILMANPGAIFRHKKTGLLVRIPERMKPEESKIPFVIDTETNGKLQVGTILYSSWGYDQTNVDFYQVTKIKGKTQFECVELMQVSDKNSWKGAMSDHVTPGLVVPGSAAKGTIFLRQNKYQSKPYESIKVNGRHVDRWDGNPKYTSWYA